jgi:2-dehydro-3-deoxyphosphogluconate aldolase/(4S)-4-hydroxy-2-oxoglutarate aldolase
VHQAVDSGAEFLFTPHTNPVLIEAARKLDIPMIPGAFSPTEIVTAWQAGASCVKVFPISTLGGVAYVKSLQGPLGEIPLIPTGGVTLKNAEAFIEAGAIAVGLSSELFPPALLSEQNWQAIAKQAEILTQQLAKI